MTNESLSFVRQVEGAVLGFAVADALGAQVRFTCCDRRIAAALEGKIPDLFPLDIQRLYYFVQKS